MNPIYSEMQWKNKAPDALFDLLGRHDSSNNFIKEEPWRGRPLPFSLLSRNSDQYLYILEPAVAIDNTKHGLCAPF